MKNLFAGYGLGMTSPEKFVFDQENPSIQDQVAEGLDDKETKNDDESVKRMTELKAIIENTESSLPEDKQKELWKMVKSFLENDLDKNFNINEYNAVKKILNDEIAQYLNPDGASEKSSKADADNGDNPTAKSTEGTAEASVEDKKTTSIESIEKQWKGLQEKEFSYTGNDKVVGQYWEKGVKALKAIPFDQLKNYGLIDADAKKIPDNFFTETVKVNGRDVSKTVVDYQKKIGTKADGLWGNKSENQKSLVQRKFNKNKNTDGYSIDNAVAGVNKDIQTQKANRAKAEKEKTELESNRQALGKVLQVYLDNELLQGDDKKSELQEEFTTQLEKLENKLVSLDEAKKALADKFKELTPNAFAKAQKSEQDDNKQAVEVIDPNDPYSGISFVSKFPNDKNQASVTIGSGLGTTKFIRYENNKYELNGQSYSKPELISHLTYLNNIQNFSSEAGIDTSDVENLLKVDKDTLKSVAGLPSELENNAAFWLKRNNLEESQIKAIDEIEDAIGSGDTLDLYRWFQSDNGQAFLSSGKTLKQYLSA